MGKSGKPVISFYLIIPEFGLQGGWELRSEILCVPDFPGLFFPPFIRINFGLTCQFLKGYCGKRMNKNFVTVAVTVSIRKNIHIFQTFFELLGECDKLAGRYFYESSRRHLDFGQQFFKLNDPALVEGEVPTHCKPVLTVCSNLQVQVLQGCFMGDGKFFSLGPFDYHFISDRLQLRQCLQAVVRILQMPFPVIFLFQIHGQIQYGAKLFYILGLFLFLRQVSFGLQPFSFNFSHDVFHTLAGFEIMSSFGKGLDEHLQSKPGSVWNQMNINSRISFNKGDIARSVAGVIGDCRMDSHKRRNITNGGQYLFARR